MIEKFTFLEEGKFTMQDNIVKEVASSLMHPPNLIHKSISFYVSDLKHDDSKKNELFRNRTASEIIESGFETGCTDVALVYVALARAAGIPARYVETFNKKWIENYESGRINGHVFVDLLHYGEWRTYEPNRGFIEYDGYFRKGNEFLEVGKGLDFSEIYLKNNGKYSVNSVSIKTFEHLSKLAKQMADSLNK
jgi:hypothetical protein